jgi:hypothetical protein
MTTSAIRALMTALVDYAGLFPPASLALEPALHNYAAYLKSDDAWMLARFVCPAAELKETAPHVDLFSDNYPLAISALGRKSASADEFIANLRAGLNEIATFREAHGPRVSVEQLEAPLPPGLNETGCRELLVRAAEWIERDGSPTLLPFFEVSLDGDWRQTLRDTTAAMAAHNMDARRTVALKLRTGGTAASAFPTGEQIAFALLAARDSGVRLKCTAGLHHPVRRYEASVQTKMHGFVNVFGAGVLAHAHGLTAAQAQMILEDEDAAHFVFDDAGFAWGEWRAAPAVIAAARRTLISFGSCSFDEPRDDLRALGWL